jgi:hypothetical protein
MRALQAAYIGRHEFQKNLIECELRQWFTFDERERRGIRKAFRSRYWIGAALHLGLLAMTGTTLGSLEYVPSVLLRHLGRQFVQKSHDLATLRSLYRHPSVGMRLEHGVPETGALSGCARCRLADTRHRSGRRYGPTASARASSTMRGASTRPIQSSLKAS